MTGILDLIVCALIVFLFAAALVLESEHWMRQRHRRRWHARRYCLWGHHGQYVQVGSQTDRYLQRRLKRDADQRRALARAARSMTTAIITLKASGVKAAEAMRQLSEACKALDARVGKPIVLPLRGDGAITYGPATVYVAPVGTTFPPVDGDAEPPWRRLA